MTASESELNRIVIETIRRAQAGERLVPQELAALYPQFGSELLAQVLAHPDLPTGSHHPIARPPGCLTTAEFLAEDPQQAEPGRRIAEHLATCARCQDEWQDRALFRAALQGGAAYKPPVVEGYLIGPCLGAGGNGVVWFALEQHSGRYLPRAIKVLRPDRFTPTAMAALRSEMAIVDALPNHANRVRVYDPPASAGPIVIQQYVARGSLGQSAPLSWERVVWFLLQAADALIDVHANNLGHGDLTPNNLLLDALRDQCLLTDFGLANHGQGVGGTPGYAAPELARGGGGPAADVFALAATACGLLTGRPPFPTNSLGASLSAAANGLPAAAIPLEVPDSLRRVLRAATVADPTARPTIREFQNGLRVAAFDTISRAAARAAHVEPAAGLEVVVKVWAADRSELRQRVRCSSREPAGAALTALTGDVVDCNVTADQPGYFTGLVRSTTGSLDIVPLPQIEGEPVSEPTPTAANQLISGRFGLIAPAGTEEFVVVWTPIRPPTEANEWQQLLTAVGTPDRAVVSLPQPPRPRAALVRFTATHTP